jgi:hypothetical protein
MGKTRLEGEKGGRRKSSNRVRIYLFELILEYTSIENGSTVELQKQILCDAGST